MELPLLFKALTISTHANSQTLTKHVPFASVFPLLKWKQVMRLGFFFSRRAYSSKFYPPDCYQLSSAQTYSLLRNDPPSRSPSIWLSPSGYTSPTLSTFASRKLRDFPQLSAHSIPSILTLITSMSLAGHIPFVLSCKICLLAKVSPFFWRVTQHRRHLWFTAFRAGLCLQALQIPPRERHPASPPPLELGPLLRLRHFKG